MYDRMYSRPPASAEPQPPARVLRARREAKCRGTMSGRADPYSRPSSLSISQQEEASERASDRPTGRRTSEARFARSGFLPAIRKPPPPGEPRSVDQHKPKERREAPGRPPRTHGHGHERTQLSEQRQSQPLLPQDRVLSYSTQGLGKGGLAGFGAGFPHSSTPLPTPLYTVHDGGKGHHPYAFPSA
jgi:hypothetical protein